MYSRAIQSSWDSFMRSSTDSQTSPGGLSSFRAVRIASRTPVFCSSVTPRSIRTLRMTDPSRALRLPSLCTIETISSPSFSSGMLARMAPARSRSAPGIGMLDPRTSMRPLGSSAMRAQARFFARSGSDSGSALATSSPMRRRAALSRAARSGPAEAVSFCRDSIRSQAALLSPATRRIRCCPPGGASTCPVRKRARRSHQELAEAPGSSDPAPVTLVRAIRMAAAVSNSLTETPPRRRSDRLFAGPPRARSVPGSSAMTSRNPLRDSCSTGD